MEFPLRPARLDPVGRLRLPRRTALLRGVLVAVLLLTAAGVLSTGGDAGDPTHPAAQPSTGPATPAPATATDPQTRTDPDGLADREDSATAAGPGRAPIPEGTVGVPVPLGEPAALTLLRAGDQVDLFAVPAAGEPIRVAGGAAVLAVDHATAAVLLALPPQRAEQVVAAPDTTRFAVILRS